MDFLLKFFFFLTLAFFMQSGMTYSKNKSGAECSAPFKTSCKAKITPELYIMIDDNCSGNVRTLEVDVTELELKSELFAKKFFAFFSDSTVSFEIRFSDQKVIIHLLDGSKTNMNQWRVYFKEKIAAQRASKGFVDFRTLVDMD
jgi:hypothetical protein